MFGEQNRGYLCNKRKCSGVQQLSSISPHVHSLSNNHLNLNAVLSLAKEGIACQNVTELCARYQHIRAFAKASRLSL